MVALPSSAPSQRRLTREEFQRMGDAGIFRADERLELIDGIVLRMPPIGPAHANIVRDLAEALILDLAGRAKVSVQSPLLCAEDALPQPDIAIVPRGDYGARHPERAHLVIEVSESTLAYDRDTKVPLYAASQVAEYWIVDVAARAIDVYSREGARLVLARRALPGDRVTVAAFPDVSVEVAAFFR